MTGVIGKGAAFFLGIGFALLPSVGPFVAVLLFISSRFKVARADLLWCTVALLYSIPTALSGDIGLAAGAFLQVAAGWLIFRAFAEFSRYETSMLETKTMGAGLLVGLGLVIALNLLRVEAWNFGTAKTIAQAIVWESSPALFGHTVLVLGGLIVILARSRLVRLGALALSALGILVSGSREAAIGWVVIALVTALMHRSASWRSRLGEVAVIAVMVAVATGLGPLMGWGQVGFLLQPSNQGPGGNLLQGTEIATGDWWDTSWVSVEASDGVIDGMPLTVYRVQKEGSEGWLRLQQAVQLQPNTTYTVSTWLQESDLDVRPGIQGWGQVDRTEESQPFVLAGALAGGEWRASVSGPGQLLEAGIADQDGTWRRVFATFEFAGNQPTAWFVGLVPDARQQASTVTEFAGFQLEPGGLTAYEPGSATRGLALTVARLPFWNAAWQGIQERPVLGWGVAGFSDYFQQTWPERSRARIVPAHPHNLFLHAWFERGLFGLAAVLLFIAILAAPALKRMDLPLLALVVAVIVANIFDATLFYGGVFYPLVAIAGWRMGRVDSVSSEQSQLGRQIAARMGLAMADTVAAAVACFLALQTVGLVFPGVSAADMGLSWSAAYVLLLWPVMSWREGLYPGYGLTPPQELKKQAAVVLYAALVLTAIVVVVPSYASVPVSLLALVAVMSLATLPMGRSLAKRWLYASGVWGRPVIVLGAGATGYRIVRSLLRTPLDGLHPVAFFDDDSRLIGRQLHGIPVEGRVREADTFAAANGVRHAIVAMPSLANEELRDLLDVQGRTLRTIQYVPNLAGLPAEDVYASSLDGMLAIEVKNNLASMRNRAIKRGIDIFGAVFGLLVLSPLLLALGLWVRLDTRGPALYRSERVGEEGEVFKCLKFRTMAVDAEARLEELITKNTSIREEYELFHKLDDDPRVTRAGRFLRKYSLDELPQLFNVLLGEMSLVGPRPYLTRELPLMTSHKDIILQAKPGMTGYWQVSERNDVTFADRLEMEAHYVRNWSIWWDIVILAKTVPAMLEKRGK
jgi:Undecaprenyl-phosphate galactose phosphotransferase WbaP